jgi:hypothetical protein
MKMGNWEPIFWIFGGGIGFFVLLMLADFLKRGKKNNKGK